MTSPETDGSEPAPRDEHFLAEVQRELGRLTREMQSPEATLDILFLAYLLKTSRFGYFSFGPVTIDVRLIEDLVLRTARRSDDPEAGAKAPYSDDCVRFFRLLSDEVEPSAAGPVVPGAPASLPFSSDLAVALSPVERFA